MRNDYILYPHTTPNPGFKLARESLMWGERYDHRAILTSRWHCLIWHYSFSIDSCYHGDGQSYRGNVSETLSGYTCQPWSSQCPHRHHRTPDNFPELKNAGSACRNPGGQAPHGPWCYTTNRKVRWEYCYIEECEEQDRKMKKIKG